MSARNPRGSPAVRAQIQTDESQSENPHAATTPSKPRNKRKNNRGQKQGGQKQDGPTQGGQKQNTQQQEVAGQTRNPVSPLTPPRPINKTDPATVNVSPLNIPTQHNGNGKRNASHGNGGRAGAGSTTPGPRNVHSPNPGERTPTMTPAAKATQIYAGPTFHASPAPSSLPIPKFFSRSMPQVNNKDVSLQSMMQEDLSEESISAGDESPTMRNSTTRILEQKAKEESPLDMFFRADREEKARRHNAASESTLSTPNAMFREKSASPANNKAFGPIPPFQSSHSRQSTETSMFPLEMDGEAQTKPVTSRTESSPSVLTGHDNNRIAQAKAKTEALKQLLLNPKNSHHSSEASLAQGQSQSQSQLRSPSPTPPRSGYTDRTVSGGSSSPFSSNSPNMAPRAYSPYNSPYANNISGQKRAHPRPVSSHLRQEVISEPISELPTTPTPTRSQDFFSPRGTPNNSQSDAQHHIPPRQPVRFEAQDALKASLGHNSSNATSNDVMEEQLRRILKMDLLPSTGVR